MCGRNGSLVIGVLAVVTSCGGEVKAGVVRRGVTSSTTVIEIDVEDWGMG